MSRKNFLFSHSSRLYQQSEETADFLLSTFIDDDEPFNETYAVLQKGGALRMADESARTKALNLAWNHLTSASKNLDARYVIPGLLEAIERFYYGPRHFITLVPWLGTAMKLAIALVWGNRNSISASTKSHAQIRRLVAAAAAWEQLALHNDQAQALDFGTIEFVPRGVDLLSQTDYDIREAWNSSTSKRGLALRTLKDCSLIWRNSTEFLEVVSEVLRGKKPSTIPLFHNTLFEAIEFKPQFWLGLSVRIQLFYHAAKFRSYGRDIADPGISVFEPFFFLTQYFGNDTTAAKTASQAMFWQSEWHAVRLKNRDYLSNLIVERPAIRIDEHTFAVGLTTIGDSVNSFVENSVFRYNGYTGIPVSEEAFRRHVSQPFEDRTIAFFRDIGWRTDHVSENGSWLDIPLHHLSDEVIPGEVDVLALHPSGRLAILAECKVLSALFTPNKMRNVAQKLGAADVERFHSKLLLKKKWLEQTKELREVTVISVVVVDRGAFMGKNAPNPVIDFDNLRAFVLDSEQKLLRT